MKKKIKANVGNIDTLLLFLSFIILCYFLINPYLLKYYFDYSLGRALILLLIINITYKNSFLGIIFSLLIIGLYNSKVFILEGMNNIKKDINYKKELYQNISPSYYNSEQNKILSIYTYIKPKSSNILMSNINSKYNIEPKPYFSEKNI